MNIFKIQGSPCSVILLPFVWIQSVPFEFGNMSGWEKILQNRENTGLFWIGKQPVFGCKIGKTLSQLLKDKCHQVRKL